MKQWRGLDRLKVERQKEREKERGWETDAETERQREERQKKKKNIYATFQNDISKISPPQHWHSTSQISAATPGLTLYKYLEILAH